MILYKDISGHHYEYSQIIKKITNVDDVCSFKYSFILFKYLFKKNIFLVTIDNCFFTFFFFSCIRNFLNLRTKGVIIRSTNIEEDRLKLKVKRSFLILMKSLKLIKIITIIDKSYINNFDNYFDYYIPDLMFYNINNHECFENNEIQERTINYIGFITDSKGKTTFFDFLRHNPTMNAVHYGHATDDVIKESLDICNFNIKGSYDYNDECKIYTDCEYIWCYFEESYDLSSAAFCKSLLYSRVPIIRKGGYLSYICQKFKLKHAVIENSKIVIQYEISDYDYFLFEMKKIISRSIKCIYNE